MWIFAFAAHSIGAYLLVRLLNRLGLGPWRRAQDVHWSEQARLLWPARTLAGGNLFFVPALLIEVHLLMTFNSSESAAYWVAAGGCGFLGALLGSFPFHRSLRPRLHFREWIYQTAVAWGVRIFWLGSLLAALFLMPDHAGRQMLYVAAGYLVFHAALQGGLLLQFLRWVRFLVPADDRLRNTVNQTSSRMTARPKAVWVMEGTNALAFAFPVTRELIFSRRLLEVCSDDEVAAICAHELAHLTESKAALAARILGSLSLFPLIFIRPAAAWFPSGGVLLPALVSLLLARFTQRLSLRLEKRADNLAKENQSREGIYAGALEKIYRENHLPVVNSSNRLTHPHLYDRMLAAGITPDYPRPKKPRSMSWIGRLLFFLIITLGTLIFALTEFD